MLCINLYADSWQDIRERLLVIDEQVYYDPTTYKDVAQQLVAVTESPSGFKLDPVSDGLSLSRERTAIRLGLRLLIDRAEEHLVADDEGHSIACILAALKLSLAAMKNDPELYITIPAILRPHIYRSITLIGRLTAESKKVLAEALTRLRAVEEPAGIRLTVVNRLSSIAADAALTKQYFRDIFGIVNGNQEEYSPARLQLLAEGYMKREGTISKVC